MVLLLAKYKALTMTKILYSLFFFCLISPAHANSLPTPLAVPGGIINIPVGDISAAAPEVLFQSKKVLVLENDKQWVAVVGISLKSKAGEHSIQIKSATETRDIPFTVIDKDYPAQYITLKNKRMVNPNPEDLKRIRSERPAINKALNTWSLQSVDDLTFQIPVIGRLSSPFGLKRFFNKQPKNPHSGLDIAAISGTDIVAPAAGIVINTGAYYYNGNTVFLDHGQGLISGYFHLSKITVKAGQIVEQGTKLGEVGATGRVTGPHLHWNVYLNKTKVDPALFVPELAKKLITESNTKNQE